MVKQVLKELLEQQRLRAIDKVFAEFIDGLSVHSPVVTMLAAYLSLRLGEQDTCIDIDNLLPIFEPEYCFADGETIRQALSQCNAVEVIATDNARLDKPLILDCSRLYMQRYYSYEKSLADQLMARTRLKPAYDKAKAREVIDDLFPENQDVDWQKVAVAVAVDKSIAFITGGPGTGKTTTVTRLLAVLQALHDPGEDAHGLNIQMVAPTGKAAARLSESMSAASARLPEKMEGRYND